LQPPGFSQASPPGDSQPRDRPLAELLDRDAIGDGERQASPLCRLGRLVGRAFRRGR